MRNTNSRAAVEPDSQPEPVHEAPTITRLGTLAELTLGGTVGPDDALGGAGDGGSV